MKNNLTQLISTDKTDFNSIKFSGKSDKFNEAVLTNSVNTKCNTKLNTAVKPQITANPFPT